MLKKIISAKSLKFTLINCLAIILGILIAYSITEHYVNSNLSKSNANFSDLNFSFSKNIFFQIFFSNIRTLLIIVFCGFFTFGLISVIAIIWNTVIVCFVIFESSHSYSSNEIFFNFFYHGVFEVPAFIIASNISFRGFEFYKKLYKTNEIDKTLYPKFKEIALLILLLTIAAFIETIIITKS